MTTPYHRRAADKARLYASMADDLIREHQQRQQRLHPPPVAPMQSPPPPDELADISNELIRRLNARRS